MLPSLSFSVRFLSRHVAVLSLAESSKGSGKNLRYIEFDHIRKEHL
jgi:hypothetical protein